MSRRRAAAIAGVSIPAVDRWITDGTLAVHGNFRQVARADLEKLLGRDIGLSDWDQATIKLSRDAMESV